MYLESSPERDQISFIICNNGEGFRKAYLAGEKPIEIFDRIGNLPGMEIIRRFRPGIDKPAGCIDYVFGEVYKESWVFKFDDPQAELEERGEELLLTHGFKYLRILP